MPNLINAIISSLFLLLFSYFEHLFDVYQILFNFGIYYLQIQLLLPLLVLFLIRKQALSLIVLNNLDLQVKLSHLCECLLFLGRNIYQELVELISNDSLLDKLYFVLLVLNKDVFKIDHTFERFNALRFNLLGGRMGLRKTLEFTELVFQGLKVLLVGGYNG